MSGFISPPVTGPATGAPEKRVITCDFEANEKDLFRTALVGSLLSFATLGIYRFWMITKLRRHYWGGIKIDGDPLEYTGKPLEILLGFLIAVIILAIYLGLINLGLTFLGISFASEDPIATAVSLNVSVFATVPLLFYARYRAMRYLLARTRWRGIRFGMAPGAATFMVRALLLWLLTIVTLGIMYPYLRFKLAKFMTDRAYFGSLNFRQTGYWTELFVPWITIYGVGIASAVVNFAAGHALPPLMTTILSLATYVLLSIAFLRFQFIAFRCLWSGKVLGDAGFDNKLDIRGALLTYGHGVLAMIPRVLFAGVFMLGALVAIAGLVGAGLSLTDLDQLPGQLVQAARSLTVIVAALGLYLLLTAYFFASTQIYFVQRILALEAKAMIVENTSALAASQQRAHDEAAEGGGFADALGVDIGL